MYSRNLLQTKHSGYISDILLPFSRRTYHVRTAKMSLYIENLSQNDSFRRFREYITNIISIAFQYKKRRNETLIALKSTIKVSFLRKKCTARSASDVYPPGWRDDEQHNIVSLM